MGALAKWIDYWNRRVKQFTIWDLKLAQFASAMFMLVVAKLFPKIMDLSVWCFAALAVACVPRLAYVVWIKRNGQSGGRD